MRKLLATIALVSALVLSALGFGSAQAATPTAVQKCTTSAEWVMGQQKAAHLHFGTALRSNADALKKYPSCGTLSPQLLNVVVAKNKTVNADGLAVWTHWNHR